MVGTATAAGVYGSRALKGLMSAVKFEEPALSIGTDALVKQSSIAARLCRDHALLKVSKLKRVTTNNLEAMVR